MFLSACGKRLELPTLLLSWPVCYGWEPHLDDDDDSDDGDVMVPGQWAAVTVGTYVCLILQVLFLFPRSH